MRVVQMCADKWSLVTVYKLKGGVHPHMTVTQHIIRILI